MVSSAGVRKENDSFSLLQATVFYLESEQEWPVHITHSGQYLLFRNYLGKNSQVRAERSFFNICGAVESVLGY